MYETGLRKWFENSDDDKAIAAHGAAHARQRISGHVVSGAAGALARYQRRQMILGHQVIELRLATRDRKKTPPVINHTRSLRPDSSSLFS